MPATAAEDVVEEEAGSEDAVIEATAVVAAVIRYLKFCSLHLLYDRADKITVQDDSNKN